MSPLELLHLQLKSDFSKRILWITHMPEIYHASHTPDWTTNYPFKCSDHSWFSPHPCHNMQYTSCTSDMIILWQYLPQRIWNTIDSFMSTSCANIWVSTQKLMQQHSYQTVFSLRIFCSPTTCRHHLCIHVCLPIDNSPAIIWARLQFHRNICLHSILQDSSQMTTWYKG